MPLIVVFPVEDKVNQVICFSSKGAIYSGHIAKGRKKVAFDKFRFAKTREARYFQVHPLRIVASQQTGLITKCLQGCF